MNIAPVSQMRFPDVNRQQTPETAQTAGSCPPVIQSVGGTAQRDPEKDEPLS